VVIPSRDTIKRAGLVALSDGEEHQTQEIVNSAERIDFAAVSPICRRFYDLPAFAPGFAPVVTTRKSGSRFSRRAQVAKVRRINGKLGWLPGAKGTTSAYCPPGRTLRGLLGATMMTKYAVVPVVAGSLAAEWRGDLWQRYGFFGPAELRSP
jgi:hypothetical protein